MTTQARPQLAAARSTEVVNIQSAAKLVAKEAGGATVAKFFEANKDAIKAVLPQHMTPDRMMKIALRALRTTPKLMNCSINSLFGAVITCAQLGLEPNTPQGHIYLIPFENRKKGITEVQVIIGYKGLIDLARRSGEIISISSHAICHGDPHEIFFGTEERIEHRPNLTGGRGDVIGFYAVAKLVGGGTQFEFMSSSEINVIRDGSQGYKTARKYNKTDTPWISNYEEMGRKTVIRRLCKYLPMSIELANAVALEGRAERNEAQELDGVLDGDFTVLPDDAPVDLQDEGAEAPGDEPAQEVKSETREERKSAPKAEKHQALPESGHDPETGEVTEEKPAAKAKPKAALFGDE